jgi:hypothetical protein
MFMMSILNRAVVACACLLLLAIGGASWTGSDRAMAKVLSGKGAGKVALHTNQKFLEELKVSPGFDVADLKATLKFVFSSLPADVQVFPTENYYYFSFFWKGFEFAGNLRLAARDRDKGVIHFAYFPAANNSSADGEMHYKALTEKDGVKVSRVSKLVYKVEYDGQAVTFHLNDLRDVKPPKSILAKDEVYIGPMLDESGFQFFLLYNSRHKIFLYVLNEEGSFPDLLQPIAETPMIEIGRRTGFAFYQDKYLRRKILIGVHTANVLANNYYDGPFDQLPDNFLKGDMLRTAINASDPSTKGNIDRFGYFKSGEGRYLISPYVQYQHPTDMLFYHECATRQGVSRSDYYKCFSVEGGGD